MRSLLANNLIVYNREQFDEIAALTSRLIARRASSFRHKYGFKLMRQTSVAMCRLKDINIVDIIETFCGTIPDYKLSNGKQNLPTRDNFEFVLVRLQSTAKLLLRIACCAREASVAFLNYIHRGFFIETCVVYVGVLSQIWEMACALCTKTILFYNGLHPFGRHLSSKAVWLPAGYDLPANLEDFLGEQWISESSRPIDSVASTMLRTAEDGFGFSLSEFCNNDVDEIVMLTDDVVANPKKTVKHEFAKVVVKNRDPVAMITNIDVGVAVSRDSMKQTMSIDKVSNAEDIQKFIKAENEQRSTGPSQISETKWKELQLKVNQILITNQGRNCVKKFKTLWHNRHVRI